MVKSSKVGESGGGFDSSGGVAAPGAPGAESAPSSLQK